MNFDNERLYEDEQVSLSETVGKEAEIAQTPADAESAATASTETESAASFDGVSPVGHDDYEAGRSRLAAEDFVRAEQTFGDDEGDKKGNELAEQTPDGETEENYGYDDFAESYLQDEEQAQPAQTQDEPEYFEPETSAPQTSGEADGEISEIKEKKDLNADLIANSAKVFGVSEGELQNEFNRYKVEKLFKKVVFDLTDPSLTVSDVQEKLSEAAAIGLKGVTVMPNALAVALKSGAGVKINVAVCAPYGAEVFRTKKYLVKKAAATAAAGIELTFDAFELSEKKKQLLIREYRQLKASARKKEFTVNVNVSLLTHEQMRTVIDVLFESGIVNVKLTTGELSADNYSLSEFVKLSEGQFTFTAAASEGNVSDVIGVFMLGAESVSCRNADELAKSFKEELKL